MLPLLIFFLLLDFGNWWRDSFALHETASVEGTVVQRRSRSGWETTIQAVERQGTKVIYFSGYFLHLFYYYDDNFIPNMNDFMRLIYGWFNINFNRLLSFNSGH